MPLMHVERYEPHILQTVCFHLSHDVTHAARLLRNILRRLRGHPVNINVHDFYLVYITMNMAILIITSYI